MISCATRTIFDDPGMSLADHEMYAWIQKYIPPTMKAKKAPMMCTDLTWSTWKTLQFHHLKVHWEKTHPPLPYHTAIYRNTVFFFSFLSIPDLICVESPTWTCWIPFKWKWEKKQIIVHKLDWASNICNIQAAWV